MNPGRAILLVAQMTPEARQDLRDRFDLYCLDGDNRRAALTVDEVDLLLALARTSDTGRAGNG